MLFGRIHLAGAIVFAVIAISLAVSQTQAAAPANQDDVIQKDFGSRVAKYLSLRKKQAGSSPKPTESSAKLAESRRGMAAKTHAVRPYAKQGDIFTPEISAYFRRQLAACLAGPNGAKIRASLRHAEPTPGFTPRVNEGYPQGEPLQSTPPTLLLNLPKLPKELQYRIIGRDFVLYDTAPNVIVDLIPGAIPAS